ncbi:MAG: asparagine synthase (glutamine-hydrolyzing) [Rhodospirillales bacterium]
MCGISGIFDLGGRPVDKQVVDAIRDALAHRGPDDFGTFTDGHVGLAHRRLSIIDIAHGHEPMIDPDTGVVLTFNGEIYNFRELREVLLDRGHKFRTRSDTEVLLKCYLEWGEDLCARFNGMFAFAIWDPREKLLLLARDRMGIKPLFWTKIGEQFVFASEYKAFFRHPGFRAEADIDAISSYLTFRQAVDDISFFKGVHKLMPGHIMTIKGRDIQERAYWTLPIPNIGEDKGEAFYLDLTEDLLSKAVSRRMVSDVPLGAYLSGGVDSSLVTALMVKNSDREIRTYSVGYKEAGYDEATFAHAVADHIGTRHEHLQLEESDYFEEWRKLIRHNDIPISIPHEIALHQLSAHMKKDVSVALSGEGADELFGGYGRVQRSPMDWKKVALARSVLGSKLSNWIASRPALKGSAYSWLGFENQMEHFFNRYNWIPFEEKQHLLSADALQKINGDKRTIGVFEKMFDDVAACDPYDRVLHAFQRIHLQALLSRLDMMSMASALEARVPFVDHELIEAVVHIPYWHKMRWNSPLSRARALFHTSFEASEWLDTNKVLIRKQAAGLVPRNIAYRKKLGFPTPLDQWMESEMKDVAKDVLLDKTARERGIFNHDEVSNLLNHRQDLPYDFYGKKVWMMMNVELWFREVVDATNSSNEAGRLAAS